MSAHAIDAKHPIPERSKTEQGIPMSTLIEPKLHALRQKRQQPPFGIAIAKKTRRARFGKTVPTQHINVGGALARVRDGNTLQRIRRAAGSKPSLRYFEFHLADHCNMNCKGCSHFAPLAEPQFADLEEYKRDLKQLQTLFSNIDKIVLMGGEPLLNRQIEAFLYATRSAFPKAHILIITNGVLLPSMPDAFWKACKAVSATIDISLYPPIKEKEQAIIQLVKRNGLKIRTHSVTQFVAFYNKKGDTNPQTAFKKCRRRGYYPMLKGGKMYICHKPATIDYFNKKYGLNLPNTGFIDIYTPGIEGWSVKEELNTASALCSYCTLGWEDPPLFNWEKSKRIITDWEA